MSGTPVSGSKGSSAAAPGPRSLREQLTASKRLIADLRRELDETDLGLIALHAELEDAIQAKARLAAIVQFSDDAMLSATPDGVIQTWNPGAQRLFGYTEAEIVGQSFRVLVPAEHMGEHEQILRRMQAGERAVQFDARRLRKNGSMVEVAVAVSAMRDADGVLTGLSVVLRDVTDRLRAEAELAGARAAMEVLAERDRMARDLHDRVIQRIFGAALTLQGAASLAGNPEAAARIERVIGELDISIDEIRAAIFTLQRGPQLPAGLRAALLDLVSGAAPGLGFTPGVSFSGPVDTDVPAGLATQVLAVAREALANVARHAHATAGDVRLSAEADLVLQVSDNGIGMGETFRRSGLRYLAERAIALGGSFEVHSEPGQGVRLCWQVPLPRH